METLYMQRIGNVLKSLRELERNLNVKISISGRHVTVDGDSFNEYEAILVLEAIEFGFTVKQSLTLKDEEIIFKKIHIKDYTRRKNLDDVRARLIGTKGKTKRVIQDISGCYLIIHDAEVGIIGDVEAAEDAEDAIINLIQGQKQSNTYRYLEERNRLKKKNEDAANIKNIKK